MDQWLFYVVWVVNCRTESRNPLKSWHFLTRPARMRWMWVLETRASCASELIKGSSGFSLRNSGSVRHLQEFMMFSCYPNIGDAMRFGYASDETSDPWWCKLEDLRFFASTLSLLKRIHEIGWTGSMPGKNMKGDQVIRCVWGDPSCLGMSPLHPRQTPFAPRIACPWLIPLPPDWARSFWAKDREIRAMFGASGNNMKYLIY